MLAASSWRLLAHALGDNWVALEGCFSNGMGNCLSSMEKAVGIISRLAGGQEDTSRQTEHFYPRPEMPAASLPKPHHRRPSLSQGSDLARESSGGYPSAPNNRPANLSDYPSSSGSSSSHQPRLRSNLSSPELGLDDEFHSLPRSNASSPRLLYSSSSLEAPSRFGLSSPGRSSSAAAAAERAGAGAAAAAAGAAFPTSQSYSTLSPSPSRPQTPDSLESPSLRRHRRARSNFSPAKAGGDWGWREGKQRTSSSGFQRVREFKVADLEAGTEGFSSDARLADDLFLAHMKTREAGSAEISSFVVRRLEKDSVPDDDWVEYVRVLSSLQHRNLINIVGHAREGSKKFLVYDNMTNGSLGALLFNESRTVPWNMRISIALGVATALAFLHENGKQLSLRRSVDSSSVYLDQDFRAKLWGWDAMYKSAETEKTPDSSAEGQGEGRRAEDVEARSKDYEGNSETPHHAFQSLKQDVFDFGVLLLELMSGKRMEKETTSGWTNDEEWTVRRALDTLEDNSKLKTILDHRLQGHYSIKAMQKYCQLVMFCLCDKPFLRPTMEEVVERLEVIADLSNHFV